MFLQPLKSGGLMTIGNVFGEHRLVFTSKVNRSPSNKVVV